MYIHAYKQTYTMELYVCIYLALYRSTRKLLLPRATVSITITITVNFTATNAVNITVTTRGGLGLKTGPGNFRPPLYRPHLTSTLPAQPWQNPKNSLFHTKITLLSL